MTCFVSTAPNSHDFYNLGQVLDTQWYIPLNLPVKPLAKHIQQMLAWFQPSGAAIDTIWDNTSTDFNSARVEVTLKPKLRALSIRCLDSDDVTLLRSNSNFAYLREFDNFERYC